MDPAAQSKSDNGFVPMMMGCAAAGFLIVAAIWLILQAVL